MNNRGQSDEQASIRASTLISGLAAVILATSGWLFSLVIQAQRDNTSQVNMMAVNQGKLETRLLAHVNVKHDSTNCDAALRLLEYRLNDAKPTPLD